MFKVKCLSNLVSLEKEFVFTIAQVPSGLWSVTFVDENGSIDIEGRFKTKIQALEYVGLRLINFYGGV